MEKDQKVLQEVKEQSQKILGYLVNQDRDSDDKFNKLNDRFDRIETAALENSKDIKANTTLTKEVVIKLDRIERNVDTAVTNHEQRVRKLEAKAGI